MMKKSSQTEKDNFSPSIKRGHLKRIALRIDMMLESSNIALRESIEMTLTLKRRSDLGMKTNMKRLKERD